LLALLAVIVIVRLHFDSNLKYNYKKRQEKLDKTPMIEMIVGALGNRDLLSTQSSKAMKGDVSVDVFLTVMPKQHDVALIHALDTKPHELGYVVELSLSCWNMAWVDVHLLKFSEEQLVGYH
jgi:hypothetical protein